METNSVPDEAAVAPRPAGETPARPARLTVKLLVLAGLVALFAVAYFALGDYVSLDYVARQEAALRQYQEAHPLVVYGAAFLIYVTVTGLSLPGAAGLTMACGWLFGLLRGVVLVSFASTAGATLALLLSRYLLRDVVRLKFGERLASFNLALEREGAFYLFSLRLIPAVPFFVINVVMGLTPLRVRTFWWVSQLGMLAGTAVYVYAGAQFPHLSDLAAHGVRGILSPRLIVAFVLLGMFPLVVKKTFGRIRRGNAPDSGRSTQADDEPKRTPTEVARS